MKIRKIVTLSEEILTEGGRPVTPAPAWPSPSPSWKTRGPGRDSSRTSPRASMPPRRTSAPSSPPRSSRRSERPWRPTARQPSFGIEGEVEHGSALIHTLKFGDHYRKAASATTLLPAVEKRAPAGTVFDIPMKHITDATIRSHHQSVEVRLADAPHPDEILIALAASAQGRPQERLAPLSTEQ